MNSCPTCGLAYPIDFTLCPRDGAKLVEMGLWSEGTVVRGKYRILSKIGQGGMGAVYKALHLRFGEIRALKVIGQELANDATFVKRFEHEAVITRKLQHPNAVHVSDIDEAEDGRPFIVMEFIDGVSLKELIQSASPIPVSRVCSIIKQAASALDAAHRLGMVHRDIKPDNIVLVDAPEGEQVKILDFGIAKVKESRLYGETFGKTLTGTGVIVGTPLYMSPEQAAGKRGDELDGRSDIYSLGIVMFQLLTRQLPFKADTTMEILLAHMQTPPTPIQMLCPDLRIPEPIANVVMRCLEKDRDLRPASARVLIEELERAEKKNVITPAANGLAQAGEAFFPQSARAPAASADSLFGQPGQSPLPPGDFPGGIPGAVSAAPATREAGPAVPPQSPAAAQPGQPRQAVSPTPLPELLPASSPRWGLWALTSIAVVVLTLGGWYFGRGILRTRAAHPEIAPPPSVGEQDGRQQTAPATSPPEASRSRLTPAATAAPTPAAPRNNALEIEKQVKGAVTEGDFYYENGEYNDAIRCYQRGLKFDGANVELRQKIQRAQKAKAAESAVKP